MEGGGGAREREKERHKEERNKREREKKKTVRLREETHVGDEFSKRERRVVGAQKKKTRTPALASAMANTLPDVSSTMSYLIESDPVLRTDPQVTNVKTAVPKNSLKVSCMRLVSLFHSTSSGNAGEIVDVLIMCL